VPAVAVRVQVKEQSLPTPKHWHKIPTKQPITLASVRVFRGGKQEQSRKGDHDEGQPDSGADLFQSLISVVNLFRGKSRMQIDMLMKEFVKAARIEGAKGEGQDVSIGPQVHLDDFYCLISTFLVLRNSELTT